VKTYLDELHSKEEDPTSAEWKYTVLENISNNYLPRSTHYTEDLKIAFRLWDAVCKGVQTSGNLVKESEKKTWNEANEWLRAHRF
jgi:hypothetical protein